MGMLKVSCIKITIALLFLTQTKSSINASPSTKDTTKSCVANERSALLAFRAGLSDPWNRLSSWEGDNCCQWEGVECSNITGHVIKLDLRGPGCPNSDVSTPELRGNISSSLTGLRHLQFLNLSCNMFNMLQIPEFLGSLHDLRYLDLSQSNFVGRIPPQLGNLSNLRYLNLDSHIGNTYSMDITWLSRLSSLEYLNMRAVNLSTVVNWVSVVNMVPSLKFLHLSNCHLGTCPDSLLHLNLTSLESLDISFNSFHKRIAPNWFWDLTSLKGLYIFNSQFYGPFPYEIGNMTSMVDLGFSMNNLIGMIPSNMKNLCNLEELSLMGNNINGSITEFFHRLPSCSLNKLKILLLAANSLTGSLPTRLESLSNLVGLDLRANKLTGPVPLWIGKLTKLEELKLSSNNLDGVIHEGHLSGLVNLEWLALDNNSLSIILNSSWVPPFNLNTIELGSCLLGPKFPMWLKWQTRAFILDISNTSISDVVPDWFWITTSSVAILDMRNNQISGSLPSTMEFMRVAYAIDLSSNQFSGTIPKLPVNLLKLDLSRNNFYGPLPVDFGAPELETLLLYENSITGTIPSSLCELRLLQLLDLSANKITGSIPDCLEGKSATNMTSLSIRTLSLKNNNISGEFPLFLQNCQQLIYLDLSHNLFFGTLPTWIGENLPSLAFLRLRYNMFYGRIPMELTNLVKLQYLDLAYNNLSGRIPKSFVRCIGMKLTGEKDGEFEDVIHSELQVDLGKMIDYTENSTVVMKGQELLYTGEIIYMVNLDLSCNNFIGEIPQDIGTLVALKNLNLSWNGFSGKIPADIGGLVQVESFDLSHNELSGEIPTSLSALTYLSHLNLSYNNLTGKIPYGSQLQVLSDPASIYIGNPGLCGPPLSKKCPGNGLVPAVPEDHKDGSDNVFLLVATSSGFVMGLWTVFCIFLFKAKWRIVYFSFYDRLYDWIYVQVAVGWASLTRKMGST